MVYLPPPELFDEDEVYAVRCVRLYDADISKLALNFSARWHDSANGPSFDGTILAPSAHEGEGPAWRRLHFNLDLKCQAQLSFQVSQIPQNACPGEHCA